MGNMIKYVKQYGEYTFAKKPLNDVDSLVLAQFAYLKFDGLVPDVDSKGQAVSVLELLRNKKRDILFLDERYREENIQLVREMAGSRRFRHVKLNYYENIINIEKETQFSAVTFFLPDGSIYLSFRGTDETIVGWKEDFNMAFLKPVPGQIMSELYVKHVTKKFEGPFYLGGHSKGGNFAVYAAMNSDQSVQERIIRIYSHDGPGFRSEILKEMDYEKIEHKIKKILPQSSLVGMLLQNQENYEVVQSSAIGLLQHNPFTWRVKEDDFVRIRDIYHKRRLKNERLNKWILSLEEEKLHLFVDTLYQIVSAAEAETLIEFTAEWKKSVFAIIGALNDLDDETKKMIWEIIKALFEIKLKTAVLQD